MKIAYLDDESLSEGLFRRALNNNHIDDDFDFYDDPEVFLKSANIYDAVFVDIQLAKDNGIEIARKLHEEQPHIIVVFLTNYPDYVFDAFGLNVFAFIEKCRLERKIGRCWTMLKHELSMAQRLSLMASGGRVITVEPKSILFFEVFQKKITVYMDDGDHYSLARQSMNSLMDLLDNSFFEYANRSVIVNIQKIKLVGTDYIILRDYQQPIYTSKARHQEIQTKFMQYHSK